MIQTNYYWQHKHLWKPQTQATCESNWIKTKFRPSKHNSSTIPNINTPLPRLQRQISVYFETEPHILNTSSQLTSTNNQNIQLTPQQIVNIFEQFISKDNQKSKNTPTPIFCRQHPRKHLHQLLDKTS